MFEQVVLALSLLLIGYGYKVWNPPTPKLFGAPGSPLATFQRIRSRDERYFAHKESGANKEEAKCKIIAVHGFNDYKNYHFVVSQMLKPVIIALVIMILVAYVYKAAKPLPPKICGSPGGPPVTSPRIRLRDGRYLAYKESGVNKEEAMHKIIVIHGFNNSKDIHYVPVSDHLVKELKLYILHFDRAGYGESTPFPERSVKSEALDVQELADALQLGSKFYVIGVSMGGYTAWSCLRYIPHRLAGIALVNPFVHYWWPHFPRDLSKMAIEKLPISTQWTFRIAHYTPWLFHWWMTQKWFPTLNFEASPADLRIHLPKISQVNQEKVFQQGVYESLYRDIMAGYANWEFCPLDVENPFSDDNGSVHLWQGYEDTVIPFEVNRFITSKLPWIKCHEVSNEGHNFIALQNKCDEIITALVILEKPKLQT